MREFLREFFSRLISDLFQQKLERARFAVGADERLETRRLLITQAPSCDAIASPSASRIFVPNYMTISDMISSCNGIFIDQNAYKPKSHLKEFRARSAVSKQARFGPVVRLTESSLIHRSIIVLSAFVRFAHGALPLQSCRIPRSSRRAAFDA